MTELKKEFFTSQIKIVRDIKETEKIKLSIVFYERTQSTCILRVCKNRDLSEICKHLMDVRHSNVVVTYDYLYVDGDTYIIEEYISGKSLEEIIEEDGVFSEHNTVNIITKVCEGLEQLHSLQPPLVHNDIKTSNIMIKDDGSVKLFDFDISRLYKSGASRNTVLFGTEEYAAPEHFGYGQSEPRTDIYSIGVTMHRMLTGRSLDNEHKSTYDGPLSKIINKCIQVASEKRYATVSLLKKDLIKHKKKAYMQIKNIAIAIFAFVLLACGVAVCANMFIDNGDIKNEKTFSSDTEKSSNESQNDIQISEIEKTTELIEESIKEDITKDITEETTKDVIEETTKDATKETTKDTVDDSTKNTIEVATKDTTEENTKSTTDDSTENETKDKTEESTSSIEEETSVHVHRYIQNVVDATCTEDGYTTQTCACGDSYIVYFAQLGHVWLEATCETPKTCERCNAQEEKALGHDYEKYVCNVCGGKDEEGYARAVDPQKHMKWGETYTEVKTDFHDRYINVLQYTFYKDSKMGEYTYTYYEREPLEKASGEYLQPCVYEGVTYYKHEEESCKFSYEIDGYYIYTTLIFDDGITCSDTFFEFNLDGEFIEFGVCVFETDFHFD